MLISNFEKSLNALANRLGETPEIVLDNYIHARLNGLFESWEEKRFGYFITKFIGRFINPERALRSDQYDEYYKFIEEWCPLVNRKAPFEGFMYETTEAEHERLAVLNENTQYPTVIRINNCGYGSIMLKILQNIYLNEGESGTQKREFVLSDSDPVKLRIALWQVLTTANYHDVLIGKITLHCEGFSQPIVFSCEGDSSENQTFGTRLFRWEKNQNLPSMFAEPLPISLTH